MEIQKPDEFKSYDEAVESIVGENDKVSFFNPATGRPIKKYNEYSEIMVYSEDTRLGYHGITHLAKTDSGVGIAYEIFDQNGELTFNEMLESVYYHN